ncbi:MAG: transposase [Rickettsia endosymbiont of Pentastiridius leporinus]
MHLLLFGEVFKNWVTHIKKTFIHPKRDENARAEFIEKIKDTPLKDLVYLDESGIEDNACPVNGWSKKGSRCYGKRTFQHKRRISMIAALCNKDIIAPLVFEGSCNSEL